MRVSLADKLHNARSILRDHREQEEKVRDIFSGTKEHTLKSYLEPVAAYRGGRIKELLIEEFDRVVTKLGKRARKPLPGRR